MYVGDHVGKRIPQAITYFVDATADITAQARMEPTIIRQRLANPEVIQVITNCEVTAVVNVYYGRSSIEAVASIDTLAQRLRNHQSAISADTNVAISFQRVRDSQTAIEAVVDVSALAERAVLGASSIDAQASVDTIAVRWRNAEADISAEAVVDVISEIVAALFSYEGNLAPGEVVIIDTDELTVEDQMGSNLRKNFSGEWWEVDPNGIDSITWTDGEADRDVELVIEKEDRSV